MPVTTKTCKWSILILTMRSRAESLCGLLAHLRPQTRAGVEIIVRENPPDYSRIGANRQALLEQAHGEYSSFIDDDDSVAGDYVEAIYPLLDGVDYVGFGVEATRDGQPFFWSSHSLKNGKSDLMSRRDLSLWNPIRRELSLRPGFEGGIGEDTRWADRLRALGIVRTEHYLPRTMYFYRYRSVK